MPIHENTYHIQDFVSDAYQHARMGSNPGSVNYLANHTMPCCLPGGAWVASLGLASAIGAIEGAAAGLAMKLGDVILQYSEGGEAMPLQSCVLSAATAGALLKTGLLALDYCTGWHATRAWLDYNPYRGRRDEDMRPDELPQYVRERQPVKFNTVKVGLFRTAKGAVAGAVKGAAFGLATHVGSKIVHQVIPEEAILPIGAAVAAAALGGAIVTGGYEFVDSVDVHFRGM